MFLFFFLHIGVVVVVVVCVCVCVVCVRACQCVCVCARARALLIPPPTHPAIEWLQRLHEAYSLTISGLLSPYFHHKPSSSSPHTHPPAPGLPFSNTSAFFFF